MNVSDSERAATRLAADGFEIVFDESAADVVLLNTCSVREKAEHKLYTRVGQIRKSRTGIGQAVVGVLGCVAQLEGETLFGREAGGIDFVLGTKALGRVSLAVERALAGELKFFDLSEREAEYDWTVSAEYRHSKYVGFVPIIEGCNKFCTYCIVPFSRGREKSLHAAEILRQVQILQAQGVREVHLIGQNVNSYRPSSLDGLEKIPGATAFSRLLRAVAATGIERVKFTTSFPRDFHADIISAIEENENLCNWAHLPVQSGSNEILRRMRRGHTIESYFEKVERIKSSPKNIALTTDIIVGFPGETDDDFEATVRLAERCEFDAAYVFKYSARPGTPAFQMQDTVSVATKTERFLRLESVLKASQKRALEKNLSKTLKVLAEKVSGKNSLELTGHTACHKVVNFPAAANRLGEIVDVKITESKANGLYGELA